jgi:hypothetical protein
MKTFNCKCCGKENIYKYSTTNTYCNNKCQKQYEYQVSVDTWLTEGNHTTKNKQLPPWIKRYIRESSDGCSICGIVEWNNKAIVLDVDHIDGNYLNNNVNNLRALCPNCHSQTDTYKNRNKGNGRTLRPL